MAANVQIPTPRRLPLSVREIRNWDEMERLRPEWIKLLQANSSLGLFSTPEWLGPWWRAYGAGKQLNSLVLSDPAAGVVAILPLYAERARTVLPNTIRRLRLVGDGSGDSDDLDLLVSPGYEHAVANVLIAWGRSRQWDVCELNCASPRSSVVKLLRERLADSGWTCTTVERPTSVVPLPSTWEQYLKQLSSKERGKIGNRVRHLQNQYKVDFQRCETIEELPNALETLFRLHQKRWESKGKPGSFSLASRRQFYYDMAAAMLAKRELDLWVLKLNGEPVAAQIGMRYRNTVHSLQEGFDPACGGDSVGYVLRSHVIRYCIETGVRDYDFLAGDQASKQRWGASCGTYTDLHFARAGSMGAVHITLEQNASVVKSWLRDHLPETMVNRIRSLRAGLRQQD